MTNENGVFRGVILRQTRGTVGRSRSVFAKFKNMKKDLIYPFNGGMVMNPPLGAGFKMFAGDLIEFRTNEYYARPEVYILKTYEVHSASGTTVKIVRDDFRHIPFVGDKIGVAPATIGGAMTAAVVTSVKNAKDGDTDVWECVLDGTITANKGDVLVEADSADKMLVKNINAFADSDADMPIAGTSDGSDFDNAKYLYTPAVGGAFIIIHKMSPLPKCVRDINKSPYNGLFKVPGVE